MLVGFNRMGGKVIVIVGGLIRAINQWVNVCAHVYTECNPFYANKSHLAQ